MTDSSSSSRFDWSRNGGLDRLERAYQQYLDYKMDPQHGSRDWTPSHNKRVRERFLEPLTKPVSEGGLGVTWAQISNRLQRLLKQYQAHDIGSSPSTAPPKPRQRQALASPDGESLMEPCPPGAESQLLSLALHSATTLMPSKEEMVMVKRALENLTGSE